MAKKYKLFYLELSRYANEEKNVNNLLEEYRESWYTPAVEWFSELAPTETKLDIRKEINYAKDTIMIAGLVEFFDSKRELEYILRFN